MKYCINCGGKIEESDSFCENCGQTITASAIVTSESPINIEKENLVLESTELGTGATVGIIVTIISIFALLFILNIFNKLQLSSPVGVNSPENTQQQLPIPPISNVIDTNHYISELGFSFDYPKDMFVMSDPDGPRIVIVPNSYKTDKTPTMTAVIISAMLNDPPMTPLEWLKGPNSGADMSKEYSKIDIDGQEAISLEGGAWIVVNTPDNKRQLSIATLPSVNPNKSLMAEMNIIIDSLVFNKN